MTTTPSSTVEALEQETREQLEAEALAAELTPDEHEEAAGQVADGLSPAEAVSRVVEAREPAAAADDDADTEQEQPPSAEEMERIFTALDKQARKHRDKVADLAGPLFADLAECPLCQPQAPGYYLHTLPAPEAIERAAAIHEILAGSGEPKYREATSTERCDACDGWGLVLSGSRDPNHRTIPCQGCQGTGHKPKLQPAQPPQPAAEWSPPPQPTAAPGAAEGMPDVYGRPYGHPHYGLHPALVGA